MSSAGSKINWANMDKSWAAGFSGLIPPTGASNNTWGPIWRFYILSPVIFFFMEMPYRWLNQPRAECAYYYYNNGSWVNLAWRQIEGNTSYTRATFGHNYDSEQNGQYNDRDTSNHHLWCIYTRRYRNSSYGDSGLYIGSPGIMTEVNLNNLFRGQLIKGNPKTELTVSTSYSTSTPYAVIKTVDVELSAAAAASYLNTALVRGSKIYAGADWRLNTGIV